MADAQLVNTNPTASTGTGATRPPGEEAARYRGGLARTLVRTLLVFTFIPLALMGGAAYWRSRGLLQAQVVEQMRVQIVDQVGDVDLSIKTKRIRLDRLIRNPEFQSVAQRALSGGAGAEGLRTEMNTVVRSLGLEGGQATFNHDFVMDTGGKIVLGSKPEWDGTMLRDLPAFAELAQGEHISYTYYNFAPLYENQLVLLTISQVRGPGATPLGTMVGVTESGELEGVLRNLASVGAGAEALFVTQDGKLIGTDPYTTQMTLLEPPADQMSPIVSKLDSMMGQTDAAPATVQFRAADGTRYFGQLLWLDSLHTGILYQIAEQRVFGVLTSLVPFTIAIVIISLAAMGLVLTLGARRVFRPLADLADITGKLSASDFTQRAVARSRDEIGLLAQSFNHMAEDLAGLYRSLEDRVEERTRQIRTAAEVAERITSTTNIGDLLNRTAQLLIEQFNFYQASIFLMDRSHRFAVLRASFGPAANDMLTRGHRLEVGSASIIGWVTAHNQPRIAADVAEDPVHMRNPLLPDTRSEAGIPIRAGNTVLGALDVQSTEPRAFGPETVVMLQTLANQIAAAVQNMTLAESSQTNMQELERLFGASRKLVGAQTREQVLARAAELVAEASYPALLL